MSRFTKALKKAAKPGVLVIALVVLVGLPATGAAGPAEKLWSVVAHFEYEDGFAFDYVLGTGLSTAEMAARLKECGQSQSTGSVVRYHCYPVAE